MLLLITACTFGTVILLVFGITMKSERELLVERMQQHSQTVGADVSHPELVVHLPFKERIVGPFLRWLASIAMRVTPQGALRVIDEKLEAAGRPWGLGSMEFMGLKVLSLAVCVILGVLFTSILEFFPAQELLLLILFGFIGYILPNFFLQQALNSRQSSIRKVLPDTLDLMLVSVEAGLGLDGAMQKVTEKMHNPLSSEIERALQEMQIGKRRADALRDMANRAQVSELSAFVATVCQADQLGVSISKILRVQSEALRENRAQKARELAAKLPVKLLFPLVFFIFPAIFVVLLVPAAINIGRALGIIR